MDIAFMIPLGYDWAVGFVTSLGSAEKLSFDFISFFSIFSLLFNIWFLFIAIALQNTSKTMIYDSDWGAVVSRLLFYIEVFPVCKILFRFFLPASIWSVSRGLDSLIRLKWKEIKEMGVHHQQARPYFYYYIERKVVPHLNPAFLIQYLRFERVYSSSPSKFTTKIYLSRCKDSTKANK